VARLLDSNLWIALIRPKSPRALKKLIVPHVIDAQAALAEPVVFEVLRGATDGETSRLTQYFEALPMLANPADLWSAGVELGRACRREGFSSGSIDLLIAVVAIFHDAELISFDEGFKHIAKVSKLRVKVLQLPP
jgi:predicted nucleic acid-binding protein